MTKKTNEHGYCFACKRSFEEEDEANLPEISEQELSEWGKKPQVTAMGIRINLEQKEEEIRKKYKKISRAE